MTNKKRIDSIDALRGLSVILMVFHHFFLDLIVLCGAPQWLFSNPVFNFLHYIFAGLFILLSGVSSRFSHSNLNRGLKCFGIALLMTAATAIINSIIVYGVLHLLGTCMILYGLTQKWLDKIPRKAQPVIYIALLLFSNWLVNNVDIGNAAKALFMFGWTYPGFHSADYFPLFPWVFVFLTGTWLGIYIKEGKFPKWFYDFTCPVFPQIGRRALIIYVLHQPILYGLIYAVKFLFSI